MKEKFLPIGTVVLLKDATKRLMITGYCSSTPNEQTKVFDYVGCLFPEGNLAGEEVALFDHEQIATIVYMGLVDDEFRELEKQIKQALETGAEEPSMTPFISNDFSKLPPLTPENFNNVLNQIKAQGEVFVPINEPTAFNEETVRKEAFVIPGLGSDNTSDNEKEAQDVVASLSEKNNLANESKIDDGQPVLQLQPIFTEEGVGAISNGSVTSESPSMPELTRL